MISLWKTVTDLDRLADLQQTTLGCYASAIASAAQYAVTVDRSEAQQFRDQLQALEKRLRGDVSLEVAAQVGTAFVGQLREYQDKAEKRIRQLHQDVSAAADAMRVVAESVSANGADHEKQLQGEIKALKTLTASEDLREIKGGIQNSTSNIEASFEQLRKSNHLVIAQLQDEIRLLHQAMQAEKRSVLTDPQSGAWNHLSIAGRIDELIRRNETFCVLLVRIRNLNRLNARYSGPLVEGALKTLLARFHQMFGNEIMVGRWSQAEFAAILSLLPSDAVALSKEVTRKLSGDYPVLELGITHNVALQVSSGMVERLIGDDQAAFSKNLEKMAEVLSKS